MNICVFRPVFQRFSSFSYLLTANCHSMYFCIELLFWTLLVSLKASVSDFYRFWTLTQFTTCLFRATHGWGRVGTKARLPKICHTFPTMMKLGTVKPYVRKIQKIYNSHDTPLSFAEISIFSLKISYFCNIGKCR